MSSTRTIVLDPDEPSGQVEVELSITEVLSACNRYLNDKKFQASLDMYYNEDLVTSWDYWTEGDLK